MRSSANYNKKHVLGDRIAALDLAKGIAIFFVIWMYCLQYCSEITFTSSIYRFIYAFHMPLFIIISGYLYSNKLKKRTLKTNIIRQFKRLMVPNVLWGFFLGCITQEFGISGILNSFWFLYTLFVVSMIYEFAAICIKNVIISTIIVSIVILLLPGFEYIKFATPFFGIGLCFGNINLKNIKPNRYAIIASILFSIILYIFLWRGDEYIYLTKNPSIWCYSILEVRAYVLRILVGSAISLSIILVLHKIQDAFNLNILKRFSTSSLGLYVSHLFILLFIIAISDLFQNSVFHHSSLICEIITLILALILSLVLNRGIEQIKQVKYINHIF